MLKVIRKNKIINLIFRNILKLCWNSFSKPARFLINRWPTSGTINCNFSGYKFKMYNECDDGLPNVFYYNLPYHEKADLFLFIELSKKSQTIIDIGANTGLFSILASKANPNANIFSIEPYNINANRLRTNLDLNFVSNSNIRKVAIGETDGVINITIPKNNSITDVSSINSSFSKKIYPDVEWKNEEVKIMTLDTFAIQENILPNLIKCDVETHEMSVFKGAENVLNTSKPTIIFECFLDNERMLFFNNLIKKYDYYVYMILEQGVVYIPEGFIASDFGLNYLITPIKPKKTFISYKNTEELASQLLAIN